ncbi:MAG: hypothetical protein PHC70_02840 [Patescibacteria group bacterium]|nr:hypothetical protein [Patescibacteria group bacterium]
MQNFEQPNTKDVSLFEAKMQELEPLKIQMSPEKRARLIRSLIEIQETVMEDSGDEDSKMARIKMQETGIFWQDAVCKLLGIPKNEFMREVHELLG